MECKPALVVALLLFFFAAAAPSFQKNAKGGSANQTKTPDETCITKAEYRTVRGSSLTGVIEHNATVKILFGYYGCNELRRDDVVAYNFSGDSNPIIKIAKGLPSDKLHLQKAEGGWNVLINGEALRNAQSQPYLLDDAGYRMLSLYERDYNGAIPADAYLLLGNVASGSLDSSRFGLVSKNDILGKVVLQ